MANALVQLSGQQISPSKIEKMRLKGHYGNEITTLTAGLYGVFAESFFHQLWKKLPKIERQLLIESIEKRLDSNGRFYLRVDKQAAFLGSFRLTEQDPIKLEVSFKDHQESTQGQPALLREMLQSEGI